MYCIKCGNSLNEEQQFCTNCGYKVNSELSNQSGQVSNGGVTMPNNGQKKSIDIEETSAKIVSDVTGTVNNIVDKSKEVAQKLKADEKINQCVNSVKRNPNTVKVFGTLVIALLLVCIGAFGILRSTPEKTVKKFADAIESKDIKKALSYTNYETIMNYALKTENYFGVENIAASKDKLLIELQKEFREEFEGITLKVNDVEEIFKEGKAAEVALTMTMIEGNYIDSESIYINLIKQKGKWVIDMTDFSNFW